MAFPTMYAVTAQVSRVLPNGYTSTTSTPTFFLHADVQGITSTDGARRIAERMIRELAGPDAEVYVTAVDVTGDWVRPTKRYSVRDQNGDELAAFDAFSHAAHHLRDWGGTGDVLDTEDDEVILTQETTDDDEA